jgi:hypothetical protein
VAATLTHEPLPVSAVMFAEWLAWLLFGLLAGALLDRWDRRRVMWTVDAARMVVMGRLRRLVGDRERLAPNRTAATAVASRPGSNCAPGCQFELCPYPTKGERYYRVELSEAFCRRQRMLARRPRVGPGPWQGGRPRALEQFWKQMEQRARPDRSH